MHTQLVLLLKFAEVPNIINHSRLLLMTDKLAAQTLREK